MVLGQILARYCISTVPTVSYYKVTYNKNKVTVKTVYYITVSASRILLINLFL